MGGAGGGGDFGGIDFSKLGGEGGMPDLSALTGGMNPEDMGDDDGDDDDDEMPALEEDKGAAAKKA